MNRTAPFLMLACILVGVVRVSPAATPQALAPKTYELMINGESFQVEANRVVRLQSKRTPGVTYQVAIRVAPVQHMKLDRLQFDYDVRADVERPRDQQQPSVKLRHQLGFSMMLTELGPPLKSGDQEKLLEALAESIRKNFRQRGVKPGDIKVARLDDHQFEGAFGCGLRIRYPDAQQIAHSTLVYVLVGKSFSASCIVEFLDTDSENVLPLVKKTIDSVRDLDKTPQPRR